MLARKLTTARCTSAPPATVTAAWRAPIASTQVSNLGFQIASGPSYVARSDWPDNDQQQVALQRMLLPARSLWRVLRGGAAIRTRLQAMLPLQEALARLDDIMTGLWAESTMAARRHLLERWLLFATSNNLPLDSESAVLFILAIPALSMQSQLAYLKALSGMCRHLGLDRSAFTAVSTALRAQGAEMPMSQAYVASKAEVLKLVDMLETNPMMQLAVMLAWKTASRWGEVAQLTKRHFLLINNDEVIVAWKTLPKGRRGNPYTPSMFTVIVGEMTARIAELLRTIIFVETPFCPKTTQQLDLWLKSLPPPLCRITGHTFKKSAATHVVRQVTERGLPLDPRRLSLLLKHTLTADLISSSTLRYPMMDVALARWLGTAAVTAIL